MKLIKTQSELKDSYDRLYKKGSGKLYVKTGDSFNDWVLNILRPDRKTPVMDISCGLGFFLKSAAQWSDYCYGGDISEYAVLQARSLAPTTHLMVANSETLPFRGKGFEIITCLGSLEHYLNPEEALKEFVRHLKPGGKIFIFVPNGYYLGYFLNVCGRGKGPSHDQEYERFEALDFWERLISKEFVIKKIFKYNPGTGVSLASAINSSLKRASRGDIWGGIKFVTINLAFRLIPLNISKYFGFLCQLPFKEETQPGKGSSSN